MPAFQPFEATYVGLMWFFDLTARKALLRMKRRVYEFVLNSLYSLLAETASSNLNPLHRLYPSARSTTRSLEGSVSFHV